MKEEEDVVVRGNKKVKLKFFQMMMFCGFQEHKNKKWAVKPLKEPWILKNGLPRKSKYSYGRSNKTYQQMILVNYPWIEAIFTFIHIILIMIVKNNQRHLRQRQSALASLKSIIKPELLDKSELCDDWVHIINKLSKVYLNSKKQHNLEIFVNKLKRGTVEKTVPNNLTERWESTAESKGINGFIIDQKYFNVIKIMYLITAIIMLLLCSFNGFISIFAENNSTYPVVIIVKSVDLTITTVYFIINCIRQTFYQGKVKRQIKEILTVYASSMRLFIDLSAIILSVFFIIFPKNQELGISLFSLIIVKLILSRAELPQLQIYYLRSERQRLIWKLIKLVIFNLTFAHILGTLLIAISKYDPQNNWFIGYYDTSFDDLGWFEIYVTALYWAATIMMTVGFGDITPVNNEQRLSIAFLQIFSVIILGYNISQIGNIFSALRQKSQKLQKKMAVFETIIKHHQSSGNQLDPFLEKKIYDQIQQQQYDNAQEMIMLEQEELINTFTQNLKLSYYKQAYKPIIQKLMFFRYLKTQTLEGLSEKIEKSCYSVGKYFNPNINPYIMVLQRGNISLCCHKKGPLIGTPVDELQIQNNQPAHLISVHFLTFQTNISYDIKAESFCHIWQISLENFYEIISKSNIDNQFYYSILHKNKLEEHVWDLLECPRCRNIRHTSFDCPKLHYKPLKSQIIRKQLGKSGDQQERKQYERMRKSKRQKKTLLKMKRLLQITQQFYVEAQKIQEFEDQMLAADKEKKNPIAIKARQRINRMNQQRFENLMYNAIQHYHLGYKQQFWNLEVDRAHDYRFYFPASNSNRLKFTPLNKPLHLLNRGPKIHQERQKSPVYCGNLK